MNPSPSLLRNLLAALVVGVLLGHAHAAQLIDDRAITVLSARQVEAKRRELIRYLWGAEGFPKEKLPVVTANVASPVKQLGELARVDEFRIDQAPGLQGLAYHFIPRRPNRELVVVHHGHACTLDDDPSPADVGYGLQRTINALLREGYGCSASSCPTCARGIAPAGTTRCSRRKPRAAPSSIFWSRWR